MDLTLPDFVEALASYSEIDVFALYVEGFAPLDGLRLARLVQRLRTEGRDVLLYRAGRTAEGVAATRSHTASLSGDYASCVGVLEEAGALVATTFEEFRGLLTLAAARWRSPGGQGRLGLLSNAGFETVGMGDNIDSALGVTLATFAPATVGRLQAVLRERSLTGLVTVRNPLDLTPMADEAALTASLEALLAEDGVDAVVMGVVPMTPALKTLPAGVDPTGSDCFEDPGALPALLPPIVERYEKPVVLVVDAGNLYDPLAKAFSLRGLPCLRSADAAVHCLSRYIAYRRTWPAGAHF